MTDTGGVTATTTAPVPAKKQRGREGAVDMVRSLAVVMVLVAGLWFFGQASPSDSQPVRRVDPTLQLTDFAAANPGVPVPTSLPADWVPNVASYDGSVLRVGYVIGRSDYAEFLAGSGPQFGTQQAGGHPSGTVDVAGTSWQQVRSGDGHESLVRQVKGVTLVVGGLRVKASVAQLQQLAAAVR